tara:strand:- start:699 stop:1118 length:420 start_codon:yes stop_codon:yes gene_type:complete
MQPTPVISRDGYMRVINVEDPASRRIGRFDCGFKRQVDGTEKKVSRFAAELTYNSAQGYIVRAVKHPLRVHYDREGLSITLAPEEEITASNNMQLDIRNSPHTICLSGVNAIWQVDTEDSDVTDDEEAMKDVALTQRDS